MNGVPEFVNTLLPFLPEWIRAVVFYGVVALVLFVSVILTMAFLTLAERRVIGSIQARIGPNRVGRESDCSDRRGDGSTDGSQHCGPDDLRHVQVGRSGNDDL